MSAVVQRADSFGISPNGELLVPPDAEAAASVYSVASSVSALAQVLDNPTARAALTGRDAGELEEAVAVLMGIIAEIDNGPR